MFIVSTGMCVGVGVYMCRWDVFYVCLRSGLAGDEIQRITLYRYTDVDKENNTELAKLPGKYFRYCSKDEQVIERTIPQKKDWDDWGSFQAQWPTHR